MLVGVCRKLINLHFFFKKKKKETRQLYVSSPLLFPCVCVLRLGCGRAGAACLFPFHLLGAVRNGGRGATRRACKLALRLSRHDDKLNRQSPLCPTPTMLWRPRRTASRSHRDTPRCVCSSDSTKATSAADMPLFLCTEEWVAMVRCEKGGETSRCAPFEKKTHWLSLLLLFFFYLLLQTAAAGDRQQSCLSLALFFMPHCVL